MDMPRMPGRKREAARYISVDPEDLKKRMTEPKHGDLGEQRLVARRLMLARGGDAAMTTSPFDLLRAWQQQGYPIGLSVEQHRAALEFRRLYNARFPHKRLGAVNLDGLPAGQDDSPAADWVVACTRRYDDLAPVLKQPRAMYDEVVSLACYERMPAIAWQWFEAKPFTTRALGQWHRLTEGLDIVAVELGITRRKVA